MESNGGRKGLGCGYLCGLFVLRGLLTFRRGPIEFTLRTKLRLLLFHDPHWLLPCPHLGQGIRYGPRLSRRKMQKSFGATMTGVGHFLEAI